MIAVDWGTSSLRLYRLDAAGMVLERRRSDGPSRRCVRARVRPSQGGCGIMLGWPGQPIRPEQARSYIRAHHFETIDRKGRGHVPN